MLSWTKPKNAKAMRGFLGLTDYYRKFIQNYGKIATPLTKMLRKNSFEWSLAVEEAFERLKLAMTQAPVLALPDFSQTFIIECDASGLGVGAVLLRTRPIAYFSHALQGKHLFLSTYEKEILALVLAVQKWRPYLLGRKFIFRTDHQSLKHLWTQKITTTAQQRWLYKLMGFNFQIEYKRGAENVVADALSRCHEYAINEVSLLAFSQLVPHWVDAIKEEIEGCHSLQELKHRILQDEAVGLWKFVEGIILFKDRIYLANDSKLIQDIIGEFHGSTHEGFVKTFQRIKANFYWQKMRKNIKDYIRQCDTCQRHKAEQVTPAGLLQPLSIPNQIWKDISMDFVEGLPASNGKTTIFVVVDRLSKYTHFIPLSHPYSAVSVAKLFFDNVFKLHGLPRSIVCDRDPTFVSTFWKELFRLNGMSFNFSSSYHPQTDGQTEVVNRTLEMYLRCFTSSRPKK
ncbi:hypothetical protein ACOSQ4_031463 [Xanthoceras sorbifolium]